MAREASSSPMFPSLYCFVEKCTFPVRTSKSNLSLGGETMENWLQPIWSKELEISEWKELYIYSTITEKYCGMVM